MKYTILAVDDEPDNLQLLRRTLRRDYEITTANGPLEAIDILKIHGEFDMIVTDHRMPDMTGVELLQYANSHYPDMIRILITAYSEVPILVEAINSGKIFRYVKKPWTPEELTLTIQKAFEAKKLSMDNQRLIEDFKDLFSGTISVIVEALDAKDKFTAGRSSRVCCYAVNVAKALNLSEIEISKIEIAGLLHDIGMIGVPEIILQKKGPLTENEYMEVKRHIDYGMKILENIKQLSTIVNIVKYHHERFDGTGYPEGLKGEEIPIGARIIALADTFDAMMSTRAYREPLDMESAKAELRGCAGSQLDPQIVNTFLGIVDTIDADAFSLYNEPV
jgi:response regulator RpfG family c-di-GMP phosphodiesterase